MVAVDSMLFGTEGSTLGASWVISIGVAIALIVPIFLIQKYGYKDGWGLAIGKGLMIGVLTAIPSALPAMFSFTGGILGTVALLGSSSTQDDKK